ncbi:hypothetical protein [Streptomyces botrytidirepellens]|uniref:hypothetical protein n=1 Tax=Streptomyces botrytidirepellens TaxID=2486417 RepID=UPI001FE79B4A|nr:hypothetical protein [Streptomyces botrytidirepellens]
MGQDTREVVIKRFSVATVRKYQLVIRAVDATLAALALLVIGTAVFALRCAEAIGVLA